MALKFAVTAEAGTHLYLSELKVEDLKEYSLLKVDYKLFSFLQTAFFFIPFNLISIVCWIGEMRI